MYESEDDWTENQCITYFVLHHCVECLRYPGAACHIKPLNEGGETKFYNYVPLCVKHAHELFRIGTIEMMKKYVNVCSYILSRGWVHGDTLYHPKMKGLT